MNTPFITVSGADTQTDLSELAGLDAEIGLLYSATPDGRNRYPSRDWLMVALRSLPRAALHVCGSIARAELLAGEIDDMTAYVHRIQVNGTLTRHELSSICALFPHHTIITQHRPGNEHLLDFDAPNHAILSDASAGRGLAPKEWTRPASDKAIGFAGGLGPENLMLELPKIANIASGEWWVDMENNLRLNDWFSVTRARAAVLCFHYELSLNAR